MEFCNDLKINRDNQNALAAQTQVCNLRTCSPAMPAMFTLMFSGNMNCSPAHLEAKLMFKFPPNFIKRNKS